MTICSQCGRVKGEVNRWWLVWTERNGERICITGFESDPDLAREEHVAAICGEFCLMLVTSKLLLLARKPVVVDVICKRINIEGR